VVVSRMGIMREGKCNWGRGVVQVDWLHTATGRKEK